MKERQQRQGLMTPQTAQNATLPLVSPQPVQLGQVTPQQQQTRPPQMMQAVNQPIQRMMSNPQAQQQPPQAQGQVKTGIQEFVVGCNDQQLHKSAVALAMKVSQPIVSPLFPSDGLSL